jgi:hypothetical protein
MVWAFLAGEFRVVARLLSSEPRSSHSNQVHSIGGADAVIQSALLPLLPAKVKPSHL